jgi:putative intracellular protease/amidase
MTTNRQNCLIVLSGAKEGNSSQSFIQSFSLLHTAFNVQIATPAGRQPEFVNSDEQTRKWFNDFRHKSFATPISLSSVDPHRYTCLVIPHSPGAVTDLVTDSDLSEILRHFVKEQKVICAIGMGVAALFPAYEDGNVWSFRRFTLTAISVFELARNPDFANLPVIPEDVIKDRGALYSSTNPDHVDEVHVVVDRHLITGQNEQSTLTAVQNLMIQCNQKQKLKDR